MQNLLLALLFLSVAIPFGVFYLGEKKKRRFKKMLYVNLISFFGILLFTTIFMFSGSASAATASGLSDGAAAMAFISAAASVGIGSIGAGFAVSAAASAALGAISEKEEVFGKAMAFVGFAEGVAIYGFVIAFMIVSKI